MGRIFKSLIQSDFGGDHKNFEAAVLDGGELWHWWRDNSTPGNPWNRGQWIARATAFPGSLIQSDFGNGQHGNFEVVAPVSTTGGDVELWHFWHDNSDVTKPWAVGQRVTEPGRRVVGPASRDRRSYQGGGPRHQQSSRADPFRFKR